MFREIVLHDYSRPMRDRLAARKSFGPYRWRPSTPGNGRGFYSSSHDMLSIDRAGSSINLRLELANDHLAQSYRRPSEYRCDDHGWCRMTPIIARLPRGRGYLAGWTMGAGMCGALDLEIYDNPADAAQAAHDMASRDAEREREYRETESEDDK